MDSFDRYIDGLGRLEDYDLYMDIDDTMELREKSMVKEDTGKAYYQKGKKS